MTADTTCTDSRNAITEVFCGTLRVLAKILVGKGGKGIRYISSEHVLGLSWFN